MTDVNCPAQYQNVSKLFFFGCAPCCDDINEVNVDGCLENGLDLARKIIPAAQKAGYTVASFLGKNATVANYQQMLMCDKNLKVFFSFASHETAGKTFYLANNEIFNYTFFENHPFLNYSQAIVLFETCYAFDAPLGGGLCSSITGLGAQQYISGITPLSFFGATETYSCVMDSLLNGDEMTRSILNKCAIENSPFVPNSKAGLYFACAPFETIYPGNTSFIIETSLGNSHVLNTSAGATVSTRFHLDLLNNETVSKVSASIPHIGTVACSQPTSDIPQIIANPLNAGEVIFGISENGSCLFSNVLEGDLAKHVDQFGMYPQQNCTNPSHVELSASASKFVLGPDHVESSADNDMLRYLFIAGASALLLFTALRAWQYCNKKSLGQNKKIGSLNKCGTNLIGGY